MTNQPLDIEEEKKMNALLQLVDDPDEAVYEAVANEFLTLGVKAVEPLELLWDVTADEYIQKRIEILIHHIRIDDLIHQWNNWLESEGSILDALLLIAKMKYPNIDEELIHKQYNKLKQDIWLELNQYLTPLEQVNVVNSIFFNYYNFVGEEINHSKEDYFYINRIFETKKGNAYSLGALLSSVLMELDINLNCIQLPHQFLLAYYEIIHPFNAVQENETVMKLSCYVDPTNGNVFAQRDIDTYFKKIGEPIKDEYFLPLSHVQIAYTLLKELQYLLEGKSDYKGADMISYIIEQVFKDTPENE